MDILHFSSLLFLSNAGILVFKDDVNHLKGLDITTQLLRGIAGSTISVIIFSEYYADSPWCLHELSIIMDLHRAKAVAVILVFYGVDPSDVRTQSSSFGLAFEDLIYRISPTEVEVSRWRTDPHECGSMAGFVVQNSR